GASRPGARWLGRRRWLIFAKMATYDHGMCKLPRCCQATMLSVPKAGVCDRATVRAERSDGGDRQPPGRFGLWRPAAHLIVAGAWLALSVGYGSAQASWLAKLTVLAEQGASRAGTLESAGTFGSGGLERAARYLRSVKPEGSAALAAQATQE